MLYIVAPCCAKILANGLPNISDRLNIVIVRLGKYTSGNDCSIFSTDRAVHGNIENGECRTE